MTFQAGSFPAMERQLPALMSYHSPYLPLLLMAFQLIFSGLQISIGVIVRRKQNSVGWMVVAGAVGGLLVYAGHRIIPGLMGPSDLDYWVVLVSIGSVCQLLFLGGLLLHLLRRSSETERIAELEAILRDKDEEQARKGSSL